MAELAVNPTRDTFLAEFSPTTPPGSLIYLQCQAPRQDTMPAVRARALLSFDLSALPANAVVSAAALYLRRYMESGSSSQSYTPYALSRHDWVEGDATWNAFKSGSAWSSAGGDYGEPSCDPVAAPPVDTYFNVLDIVIAAQAAGTTVDVLIRDTTELGGESASRYVLWYSRNWGTENQRPLLTIEYTAAPIVATAAASDITHAAARLNASVTSDGGETCEGRFRYRAVGAETWTETAWGGTLETTDPFYADVADLAAFTLYEFQAQGRNSIGGTGDWTASESFTTYPDQHPYHGQPYRVEVHTQAGALVAIPRAVFSGPLTRSLNMPDGLSFQIAADDPACKYMTPRYELWVRDLSTGEIVSRCKPIITEASNQ